MAHLSVEPAGLDSDDSGDRVDDKQLVGGKRWILAQNTVGDVGVVVIWLVEICGHDLNHLET